VATIDAVVVAIAPDFQAAKVHTAAGDEYSISHLTGGISLGKLHEGTRVDASLPERCPESCGRAFSLEPSAARRTIYVAD
jgi:hypothetical protein